MFGPETTLDDSAAMEITRKSQYHFAVESGDHNMNAGASNNDGIFILVYEKFGPLSAPPPSIRYNLPTTSRNTHTKPACHKTALPDGNLTIVNANSHKTPVILGGPRRRERFW